jgi:serine/threonine protein kinase
LGIGAFGMVWEIKDFSLDNSSSSCRIDSSLEDRSKLQPRPDAKNRQVLVQQQQQQQHGMQYAMKALSEVTINNKNLLYKGLVGLAIEAHLLSQIEPHPHIIKMRAVADINPFHQDFFMVIDRLYGTLDDRINDWKSQEKQQKRLPRFAAVWNPLSPQRGVRRQQQQQKRSLTLWEPRYQACHDLASALEHLRHHRIVHRDIKPQNIGYNIRGDLTLFDFGLSRILPFQSDQDGLYKMAGYIGSPRYMAPEVANRQPYNEQCDVYSFAMLAWQILTLEKPFEGYQIGYVKVMVWQEPFVRPDWYQLTQHGKLLPLIDKAWSHDWKERPTIQEIRTTFRQELIHLRHGDVTEWSQRSSMGRHRRRSKSVVPVE